MNITFGDKVYPHVFIVGGVRHNLIGGDFISTYRYNWDHNQSSLEIKGSKVQFKRTDRNKWAARVIALETFNVPVVHEAVIKSGLAVGKRRKSNADTHGILTPERTFLERHGLALAKTLVDSSNEVVLTRVCNPGPTEVRVYKHTHMAIFTPVCCIEPVVNLSTSLAKEEAVDEVFRGEHVTDSPEHMALVFEKA
ncbi:unnamed protein product [Mytilus coruscus]|uniref:Uncharacterized protein n=1 Tax=Mytilus coruscus TaxID=42192 RepID=A0A6J8ADX1_MYTCO|nr:unnamed protein product [Mytilus coruscus]